MITIIIALNSCEILLMDTFLPNGKIAKDDWYTKKSPSAVKFNEEKVKKALQNVLSRPINKEIMLGEVRMLIPQGTELDNTISNLIDKKSGYGLPVVIFGYCNSSSIDNSYYKKVNGKSHNITVYDNYSELGDYSNQLLKKIAEVNGFTKGCSND